MALHKGVCGTKLVLARPAEGQGPVSAFLEPLLSFFHMFRVILFSPPLIQQLFLKSVSFQLNLAQSDWEHCSARICSPSPACLQTSSLLWACRAAVTTGAQGHWAVGGNLPASRSWLWREGLSKVPLPQLDVVSLRCET